MGSVEILFCQTVVILSFVNPVWVESPKGRLSCPARWREGDTQILKCTIKVADYVNGSCLQFSNLVDFQFTAKDHTDPSSECKVYTLAETCDGNFRSRHCRCREVSDGCYVLELAVTARRENHEGGSWKCVPGCWDRFFRNPFLHGESKEELSCGPVEFDDCGSSASPSLVSTNDINWTAAPYVRTLVAFYVQPFVVTHMFYIMNFL